MLVPNASLREAVLRKVEQGESWSQLALCLGWRQGGSDPDYGDTSRLKRRLGVIPGSSRDNCSQQIGYDLAVEITNALGIDPIDVGL